MALDVPTAGRRQRASGDVEEGRVKGEDDGGTCTSLIIPCPGPVRAGDRRSRPSARPAVWQHHAVALRRDAGRTAHHQIPPWRPPRFRKVRFSGFFVVHPNDTASSCEVPYL